MKLNIVRALVFILSATFWVTANGQTTRDVEHDRLLGPVRTVSTEVAEFTTKDGKSVEGPRVPLHTVTYNAHGNRIKRVDFNRDGSVAQTLVYNYDADGRNVGYEDYVKGLSEPRKHIYTLDKTGNRVEYRIVQPDGKAGDEKYVYKYDDKGNLVAEELYYKTTTIVTRTEKTYDQQGRLVSQTSYNPDSTVSMRMRVSLAPDGKPIERTRHDGDILTYRVRYTYDKKRRLVEVETTGTYIDTDFSSEGHITGTVVYLYSGKDQPKEMLINQDGALRERVVIDYDSRGNWTKRTHRVRDAQTGKEVTRQIDYRTITYH